jgi:hypothetical protein
MLYLWPLGILLLAAGCRTPGITHQKFPSPPDYTLIYIIHGDADYLYHTTTGQARQADKHALSEAKRVARNARHGEVFIFYQKPERKILWIFPKKDRQFLYYRNGQLVRKKRYSPHSTTKAFITEAKLYHKYTRRRKSAAASKILLYFGHEIPVQNSHSYYYSRPNASFSTNIFVSGVKSFLRPDASPFDLVVLSTCNNGTPLMIHKLTSAARYVLASPQDLHLSYIDSGQIALWLEDGASTAQIADSMAAYTYRRLSGFLETAVTLSVYNTAKVKNYLPVLTQQYKKHLKKLPEKAFLNDNIDCAALSFFHISQKATGVKTWYKAPQFGKKSGESPHYSGWGCKN